VAVDRPQIDRPARAASRAEDVEPGRAGEQRGADRGRPRHVARALMGFGFGGEWTAAAVLIGEVIRARLSGRCSRRGRSAGGSRR
jgi:hypothetical protein